MKSLIDLFVLVGCRVSLDHIANMPVRMVFGGIMDGIGHWPRITNPYYHSKFRFWSVCQ